MSHEVRLGLRQSAEELALKKGDGVTAVVKATEVMIPE